jgi:hypothetical protein
MFVLRSLGSIREALILTRRNVSFPMNESGLLPQFETGADARDVKPASGGNRALVLIALKIIRTIDVIAVINELDAVEGHRGFSDWKTKEQPSRSSALPNLFRLLRPRSGCSVSR